MVKYNFTIHLALDIIELYNVLKLQGMRETTVDIKAVLEDSLRRKNL